MKIDLAFYTRSWTASLFLLLQFTEINSRRIEGERVVAANEVTIIDQRMQLQRLLNVQDSSLLVLILPKTMNLMLLFLGKRITSNGRIIQRLIAASTISSSFSCSRLSISNMNAWLPPLTTSNRQSLNSFLLLSFSPKPNMFLPLFQAKFQIAQPSAFCILWLFKF